MADEEYLKIIRQRATAWNAWREKNPGALPDLSQAKLYEANLIGAKLRDADLSEEILSKADLCGANLHRTSLWEANLTGANIGGARASPQLREPDNLRTFVSSPLVRCVRSRTSEG